MTTTPKLTAIAACRVAGIDRDMLNSYVSTGHYRCAPATIPGRARLFDPDDMIALCLFRRLMDDGLAPAQAGRIACAVAEAARRHPEAPAIAYVQTWFVSHARAMPAEDVPPPAEWDQPHALIDGSDIRQVMTFRIGKLRQLISHHTEELVAIIGEDD